ncbi:MAG: YceI family protein [Phenylobacterium sp.]
MRHPFKFAALGLALALAAGAPASAQISTVPAQVQAGAYKLDSSHGKITWSVSHFGFSTYVGQFATVNATLTLDPANLAATKLEAVVDTTSVGTLNAALDTHLKSPDFLDTAKFPTATFKATTVTRTGDRTADIAGNLTLHGVTKPVVVKATFNQAGPNPMVKTYQLGFAGSAVIKRSDFGITTYVPAIGDEVTLTLEAEFRAVPAA